MILKSSNVTVLWFASIECLNKWDFESATVIFHMLYKTSACFSYVVFCELFFRAFRITWYFIILDGWLENTTEILVF